jgi:hypothetical protein
MTKAYMHEAYSKLTYAEAMTLINRLERENEEYRREVGRTYMHPYLQNIMGAIGTNQRKINKLKQLIKYKEMPQWLEGFGVI